MPSCPEEGFVPGVPATSDNAHIIIEMMMIIKVDFMLISLLVRLCGKITSISTFIQQLPKNSIISTYMLVIFSILSMLCAKN